MKKKKSKCMKPSLSKLLCASVLWLRVPVDCSAAVHTLFTTTTNSKKLLPKNINISKKQTQKQDGPKGSLKKKS